MAKSGLNLQEAAAEILAKSIANSPKEEPKAIRDPKENDTGPAVVKNTAPKKNYAKDEKKNEDEQTKNADKGEQTFNKLSADKNVTKNPKAPVVDNDGIEEACDDKDEMEVDGDEFKAKKKKSDDSDSDKKDDDMKEERISIADYLDSKIELDISEDIEAMFKGTDLSEEFIEKASTIFEAAVRSKVKEITANLAEVADEMVEQAIEQIDEETAENIADFMQVVAAEWLEENQVPLESQLKAELTEDLINALRNVFLEHNVDIPEAKVDVVNEMAEELEELKATLDEEVSKKIENYKYIKELESKIAFTEIVEEHNLTVSQKEKIRDLAEDLDFDTIEKYAEKVNTLIENYILGEDKTVKNTSKTLAEEAGVEAEEVSVDMNVKAMADALNWKRKR